MVPTFLQKRRTDGHSVRVPITLFSLLILIAIYTTAIPFVIADRAFTRSGKLALIAFLLVTALMILGLLERLRLNVPRFFRKSWHIKPMRKKSLQSINFLKGIWHVVGEHKKAWGETAIFVL